MAVAIPGVSTGFSVGSAASTAVAAKNTARTYMIICNLDPVNTVYICFGTSNAATALAGIPIPPGGVYEKEAQVVNVDGAKYETGIPYGDVSAIATAGQTVNISYYEK